MTETEKTTTESRLLASRDRLAEGSGPPVFDGSGADQGDVELVHVVEDTAIGSMLLVARGDGRLVASLFVPTSGDVDAGLDRLARQISPRILGATRVAGGEGRRTVDAVRRQLEQYLTGRRHDFDVRLDLALTTPFQRQVLTALPQVVSYGRRASYGELAAGLGRPKASRAVGTALGANPLCVVLPCHRVVSASGALTGYAGGLAAKKLLLKLEAGAAPPRAG
jgi:methylated-DNA-[protein]-cysteine S-methyltransferase